MIHKWQTVLLTRVQQARARPDRGMETLEYVAWAAGIVIVIGGLVFLVNGALTDFWNSIDFASVLP